MSGCFPFVSIVVPVFNEEKYIRKCLDSVAALDYPKDNFEVIVVDNGSVDKSISIVKEFDVNLITLPGVKVGAVRNRGASIAGGQVLAFLDADCVVDPDWLKQGTQALSHADVIGGLVRLRPNPSWMERNWLLDGTGRNRYQNTLIGANIFIKKEVFERIGGFDETMNAGEDSELSERLVGQGYCVEIDTAINVVHLGFPVTIREFIDRQRWQASDYIFKLGDLFNDKVLCLVVLDFFALVAAILGMFSDTRIVLLSTFFLLAIPLVFSIKRINRYGVWKSNQSFLSVYFVDHLYVSGRLYGLLTGLFQMLTGSKNEIGKISKRSP